MDKKIQSSDTLVPLLTIISDIIAIETAFLFSYWLRFFSPVIEILPFDGNIPPLSGYITISIILIPFWIMIFQSRKMYRPRRVVFIFDEFFIIGRLVTFAIIFSFGLIFFYRSFPFSRLVFVMIWFISIILITLGRYFVLKIEKTLYNKGKTLKQALIVGNNSVAQELFYKFINHPYTGYKVIGYVDDDEKNLLLNNSGCKRLGSYSDITKIIKDEKIETAFITIPSKDNEKLVTILKISEGENIEFLLIPDFLEMITSSVRVQEIDGIPFLKIKSIPMNIWNRIMKRIFDIILSSIFLLILSPLFILLMILIKLSSKGPVFYSQERISIYGKKFDMLKFRSMIHGAEKKSGAVFAKKDDHRYTPIGKYLRKYSLDELPQFINVFKGEMSIVGPRPEREYFINIMKGKIPKYLERHRVKCGITGWAQVNGLRGSETSLEKRIEYDIFYIENWSLVFDMKIIIKTLREIIFSKAAF